MSKKVTYDINLLLKDPFFETRFGQFLNWAVNVGRYIVIFTELVVIVSFGARFTLDRKLADLNSKIHQKEVIIESQQEFEAEFRLVQAKISSYQQIEQQNSLVDIFPILQRMIPSNFLMQQLNIKQNKVTAKGVALSNDALNYLISNLQLSPIFTGIAVSNIETTDESQSGLQVQISADYQLDKDSK